MSDFCNTRALKGSVQNTDGAEHVEVRVFVDGTQVQQNSASADGSFDISAELEEGEHTVRIQARELNNVTNQYYEIDSDERRILVDTSLPTEFKITGPRVRRIPG